MFREANDLKLRTRQFLANMPRIERRIVVVQLVRLIYLPLNFKRHVAPH